MATAMSNRFRFLCLEKAVNVASDTFKIALVAAGYTFDRVNHKAYADISPYELTTLNGYTAGGATLTGITVTEDSANNLIRVTWNNAQWTATGGNIGPAAGAFIYDDTVASPTNKPLVQYIDFGGSQSQINGGVFTIAGLEFDWTD